MPDDWDQIEAEVLGGLRDMMRAWRAWREAQPMLVEAGLGADAIVSTWGEQEAALEDGPDLAVREESESGAMPSISRLRRMVRAIRETARVCPAFRLSTESQATLKRFDRPGDDDGPPVLFDAAELAYLEQLGRELDDRYGS